MLESFQEYVMCIWELIAEMCLASCRDVSQRNRQQTNQTQLIELIKSCYSIVQKNNPDCWPDISDLGCVQMGLLRICLGMFETMFGGCVGICQMVFHTVVDAFSKDCQRMFRRIVLHCIIFIHLFIYDFLCGASINRRATCFPWEADLSVLLISASFYSFECRTQGVRGLGFRRRTYNSSRAILSSTILYRKTTYLNKIYQQKAI